MSKNFPALLIKKVTGIALFYNLTGTSDPDQSHSLVWSRCEREGLPRFFLFQRHFGTQFAGRVAMTDKSVTCSLSISKGVCQMENRRLRVVSLVLVPIFTVFCLSACIKTTSKPSQTQSLNTGVERSREWGRTSLLREATQTGLTGR